MTFCWSHTISRRNHFFLFCLSLTSSTYSLQVQRIIVAPDHTHRQTRPWQDASGRGFRPSQRRVPDNSPRSRETFVLAAGFERTIPTSQQLQTYALDQWDQQKQFLWGHKCGSVNNGVYMLEILWHILVLPSGGGICTAMHLHFMCVVAQVTLFGNGNL